MKRNSQPDLHLPGWREMPFFGRAETDGHIWWYEEKQADGSIFRHALQPYRYEARSSLSHRVEPSA